MEDDGCAMSRDRRKNPRECMAKSTGIKTFVRHKNWKENEEKRTQNDKIGATVHLFAQWIFSVDKKGKGRGGKRLRGGWQMKILGKVESGDKVQKCCGVKMGLALWNENICPFHRELGMEGRSERLTRRKNSVKKMPA